MAIDGFFDEEQFTLFGYSMTLNELEKNLLNANYPDARLHFVLVCGALGCPKIYDGTIKPVDLDKFLDHRTREALNDPDFVRSDRAGNPELSQIFKWYAADFGEDILGYINKYRKYPFDSEKSIFFYEYDWNLNKK